MNHRERFKAVLRYEKYDRMPVAGFGFWHETLWKWRREGHLTEEEVRGWQNGSEAEFSINKKLGFEFNAHATFGAAKGLFPLFEEEVLEEQPDGYRKVRNKDGVIELRKKGVPSIPPVVDYLLKDRKSWEWIYLPRLQYTSGRIDEAAAQKLIDDKNRLTPVGLDCGSLFGQIRNWMGVVNISYLYADDEELYDEMIDTVAGLTYSNIKSVLELGIDFDYAHFWEDICYKNGPLVTPSVFYEKTGPHYKRITEMLAAHDIDIVSLDCDGLIDSLIPTWLENGVNTMFPIEVGTWGASIAPWREKYGRRLLGVGGVSKNIFGRGREAIDDEIERIKPLVDLGGYLPCPDHNIPPDAIWENVQYYCDRMHREFS